MPDPTAITDWSWGPMPAVSGWFAVVRSWDPAEGMSAGVVYANQGIVSWPGSNGMALGGRGHAGPFATQAAALAWADAHDPETPDA